MPNPMPKKKNNKRSETKLDWRNIWNGNANMPEPEPEPEPIRIRRNLLHSTGTQTFFIPFFAETQIRRANGQIDGRLLEVVPGMRIPQELLENLNAFSASCNSTIDPQEVECFITYAKETPLPWQSTQYPYLRYRIGWISVPIPGGHELPIYGIWVAFETNWGTAKDGYCIGQVPVTEEQQKRLDGEPNYCPPLPYIANSPEAFYPRNDVQASQTVVQFAIHGDNRQFFSSIQITVSWINPMTQPLETDLIIDLGNTRTVALLLYPPDNGEATYRDFQSLRSYCRPLRLAPMKNTFISREVANSLENAIVDTWFLICKPPYESPVDEIPADEIPVFEEWVRSSRIVRRGFFRRKETQITLDQINLRVPYSFTQIAPIVCGNEAKRMYTLPLAERYSELRLRYEQSSPKRYYWQNTQSEILWSMLLREYDRRYQAVFENAAANPYQMCGEILRFMPSNGDILPEDQDLVNNEMALRQPNATYPRSSTLTWFLVNILEKAWEQMNQDSPADQLRPKRLRRVLGTYPSGWTQPEIELYRKRWQEAINIFRRTHFPEGANPIDLDICLDEAMAGQIPFLASEVQLVNGRLNSWLNVAGKQQPQNNSSRVRIMNIDIGGGTTDIAVIEHSRSAQCPVGTIGISSQLLTKECFTIAGDSIVKKIIEQIIVPLIGGTNLQALSGNIERADQVKRVRAIRGCLIPLANAILKQVMAGSDTPVRIRDYCSNNDWRVLCELINSARDINFEISFAPGEVDQIVESLFQDLIERCAFYAYAYDVDYVFLSGKPSELPKIREIVDANFGLPSDRIIAARNYMVGDWYPFGNGQIIGDAKSVTAVGCAVKHALDEKRIPGWCIESLPGIPTKNEWCVIQAGQGAIEPAENGEFMDFEMDEMNEPIYLNIGAHIARRQNSLFRYEPVYKLESNDPTIESVRVRFRRTNDGGDALEIVGAETGDGIRMEPSQLRLTIWPCASETYQFWQDSGILDIIER